RARFFLRRAVVERGQILNEHLPVRAAVADQEIMRERPGLRVEHRALAIFVVIRRIRVDKEELIERNESASLQFLEVALRWISDARALAFDLRVAVEIGQSLGDPEREIRKIGNRER